VYSAANALILASSREGWPNVLLESMACGTPVIATQVGGVPEIVCHPDAGIVVEKRQSEAIAVAAQKLLAQVPHRSDTRRHAEKYGWRETARGQIDLLTHVAAMSSRHASKVLSERRPVN
jgi:glycosyltransferase involved in cell wall biosynthesis